MSVALGNSERDMSNGCRATGGCYKASDSNLNRVREERLRRNRESAKGCRAKKKREYQDLLHRLGQLEKQYTRLKEENQNLKTTLNQALSNRFEVGSKEQNRSLNSMYNLALPGAIDTGNIEQYLADF